MPFLHVSWNQIFIQNRIYRFVNKFSGMKFKVLYNIFGLFAGEYFAYWPPLYTADRCLSCLPDLYADTKPGEYHLWHRQQLELI